MAVRNIRYLVEYDGTNYHGWQRQKNAITIQQVMEEAIHKLTQEDVNIIASGRTDSGVHARGQVINFKLNNNLEIEKLFLGTNSYLPDDIRIKNVDEVPERFHSRFDAKKRTYHYYLMLGRTAIYRDFCWQFFQSLDLKKLELLAPIVIGQHDFSAFSKKIEEMENYKCAVYESEWFRDKDFWIYRIVANRFLHGMVRTLVGTMVDVARGRFTVQEFNDIFTSGNRNKAGGAAPAKGLFLEQVMYNESNFN